MLITHFDGMTTKFDKRNFIDKKKNYGYMLRESTHKLLTEAAHKHGITRATIIDAGVLKESKRMLKKDLAIVKE